MSDSAVTYYAVLAQVIPVLIVVLLFQARVFDLPGSDRRSEPGRFNATMLGSLIIAVVGGIAAEYAALVAVGQGYGTPLISLIEATLVPVLFALIALRVLFNVLEGNRSDLPPGVEAYVDRIIIWSSFVVWGGGVMSVLLSAPT
jgi:hypothetical protein